MGPTTAIAPSGAVASADGRREAMKRLTDKVLAAFNHAYAIGETSIAERLRELLASVAAMDRQSGDPLAQADAWVEFVKARNQYRWICENRRDDPAGATAALSAMKDAYRRWSVS
jgi:hypothetical protein